MEQDIPYLLVGTYGWDNTEWSDNYYDEEEPREWRFLTYSGHFRSVLVPAAMWSEPPDAGQWAEEADDAFRFVLELPSSFADPGRSSGDLQQLAEQFFQQAQPIREQTVGLYLQLVQQPPDMTWLRELFSVITPCLPLSIALPVVWQTEEAMVLLQQYKVGQCWFPDEAGAMPGQWGQWMMAISETSDLKQLRSIIERFSPVLDKHIAAGLFFRGKNAADAAERARIIADLLIV
ncbi:MAG: hypothetical protein BMS9Abin11_0780 [Gammaproteobacteria bacterium]|nr:MAG: hypothetical protein BMS9Abin11_0780 [Gammaproteobacteria bacterium]